MYKWSPQQICNATNAHMLSNISDSSLFNNISIDSRIIHTEDLFVALIGDNHDGHDYIQNVLYKNVKGIIIQSDRTGLPILSKIKNQIYIFVVKNTTTAIGDLAAFKRKKSSAKMVGITGTNGKTSTKEMTASIIQKRYCTLKTLGNLNNHIGVPMTLLKLKKKHQWGIIELGMNHVGEIKYLSKILKPDIGLITNIGPGHLEGVQNLEGVAVAKRELIESLSSNGRAILNADDPMLPKIKEKLNSPYITFGINKRATISASNIKQKRNTSFVLNLPETSIEITIKTPGKFMVYNALAAASVSNLLQIPEETIKKGLEEFEPVKGRLVVISITNKRHIIDDTYNANPVSMKVALETLASLKGSNRSVFVVGDMFELGKNSFELHKNIGKFAAYSNVDLLLATGSYAEAIREGAIEGGISKNRIVIGNEESIKDFLLNNSQSGDWFLIKGSRAMGMEKYVNFLKLTD